MISNLFGLVINIVHGIGVGGILLFVIGVILLSVSFKKDTEQEKKKHLEISGSVIGAVGIMGIVVLVYYYI